MGDCQNYGPFLGPYYNAGPNTGPNLRDPKTDHNFDNPPRMLVSLAALCFKSEDSRRLLRRRCLQRAKLKSALGEVTGD